MFYYFRNCKSRGWEVSSNYWDEQLRVEIALSSIKWSPCMIESHSLHVVHHISKLQSLGKKIWFFCLETAVFASFFPSIFVNLHEKYNVCVWGDSGGWPKLKQLGLWIILGLFSWVNFGVGELNFLSFLIYLNIKLRK